MTGSNQIQTEKPLDLVDEKGPWPFVTRRVFRSADESKHVWSSRHHRKDLLTHAAAEGEVLASLLLRCLWMPRRLNWWIGIIFALGSLLMLPEAIYAGEP